MNAMSGARWEIAAGDTLVVAAANDGVRTELERHGERLAHFTEETSEGLVVAFARRVAEAAGCTIDHRELARQGGKPP